MIPSQRTERLAVHGASLDPGPFRKTAVSPWHRSKDPNKCQPAVDTSGQSIRRNGHFLPWYTGFMFEQARQSSAEEPRAFLTWFAAHAPQGTEKAEQLLTVARDCVPGFGRFFVTPQGGPWHCEGRFVSDHIRRILTTLFAVQAGASLSTIEEFARERDVALEIVALEQTIRDNVPLLAAFALAHDLAKPDTLVFDAAMDTKGAAEGFVQHDKRQQQSPSSAELQRYDKLFRAYTASRPGSVEQHVFGFYEAYGIATHYYGHANIAAGVDYEKGRQAVLDVAGVSHSYHLLLTELIRQHIDVLGYFRDKPDGKKYEFLATLAGRLGLNVDLYLDLTIAEVFLDAVAGTLQVRKGKLFAQTDLVIHILRAEREALPQRNVAREEAAARQAKQAHKDLLASVGLSGDAVFALLGTPIGPERGEVMAKVNALLHDSAAHVDFGPHTAEITRRITAARALLASH